LTKAKQSSSAVTTTTTTTTISTTMGDSYAEIEDSDSTVAHNMSNAKAFVSQTNDSFITTTNTTSITALTDGQEVVLSMLMVVSGVLSILGSATIIYKVIKNRDKAKPYDRLMFGLSTCDIIGGVAYALTPFLLPRTTSPRVWAFGTAASCSFLGFLTQFSFSGLWYNCMLSFYYLLTVRFGVKRSVFATRYEFWMHLSAVGFNAVTASFGYAVGMYGELELNLGCWISYYPKGCQYDDSCVGSYYGWGMAGLPVLFTMFAIPINNAIIYCHVRKTLHYPKNVENQDQAVVPERDLLQQAQIREVSSQGFLYVGAFMLCFLPAFIVRVLEAEPVLLSADDEPQFFWLLALNNFLLPLQGLFNMLIYSRPNYVRVRGAFPEQTVFWSLRRACLEGNIPRLTESRWSSNLGGSQRSFRSAKAAQHSRGTGGGMGGDQQLQQQQQQARRNRRSHGSRSGGSGFSSDLDIVAEDSNEDREGSSSLHFAVQDGAHWEHWMAHRQVMSTASEDVSDLPLEQAAVVAVVAVPESLADSRDEPPSPSVAIDKESSDLDSHMDSSDL
jgi:hypothetical protein